VRRCTKRKGLVVGVGGKGDVEERMGAGAG
jgi:hypothetical protein